MEGSLFHLLQLHRLPLRGGDLVEATAPSLSRSGSQGGKSSSRFPASLNYSAFTMAMSASRSVKDQGHRGWGAVRPLLEEGRSRGVVCVARSYSQGTWVTQGAGPQSR